MPGRTPPEAVDVFLAPLRQAVAILDGYAQLTVNPPRGGYRKGTEYIWSLNGEAGLQLDGGGTFFASMRFVVVDSDPAQHDEQHQGRYRCTTRGYNYKLRDPAGRDQWRLHWHPVGLSPAKGPHQHIRPDLKRHLPTGRTTFEDAIVWAIEYGAPIRYPRDEAIQRLALIEAPHKLYRTWSDIPPAVQPLPTPHH